MRTLRWVAASFTLVTVLTIPSVASADGGAYIELDRTHYLVGSTATGVGYVAVPEPKQDLLERGPFYVYVLPHRAWIQEGRPIPIGAIRAGTATIEQTGRTEFAVRVAFTVPNVQGDYYNVAICNDPCTISGFREPLTAYMSIIQTAREGELLTQNADLQTKMWHLRRQAKKAEKTAEELEGQLASTRDSVLNLSTQVAHLKADLAAAATSTEPPSARADDRPLVDAWALFAILTALLVGLVAIGLALAFGRRSSPGLVVPDTIAELDGVHEDELTPAAR